jgi:tyrosinase
LATRKNVELLSATEVAALRAAFTAVKALTDDRGYAHHAGIHGLPLPTYCHHGDLLFLPWHRAYLYFFELALQDRADPSLGLPWWDWTSVASHTVGIPASYDEVTAGGAPNPLAGSAVSISASDATRLRNDPDTRGSISDTDPPTSVRDPDDVTRLPDVARVQRILKNETTFVGFSNQLEVQVHNKVHGWVGGTMSVVAVAAYDPIFWAHHTMIDRLWYLWQLDHPGAGVPAQLVNRALAPFPVTVADVLDIAPLGYEYAAQSVG